MGAHIYIIRSFGSAEYMRHHGFSTEGELVFNEVLPRRILVREIQKAVALRFDLPLHEMWSARRAHEVSHPRQIAMYLSKELTTRSLPEIGRMFGNRDHTTVIHGCRQVARRIKEDAETAFNVRVLTAALLDTRNALNEPTGDRAGREIGGVD